MNTLSNFRTPDKLVSSWNKAPATSVTPAPTISGNTNRIEQIKAKMSSDLFRQPVTLSTIAYPMQNLFKTNEPSVTNIVNQYPGAIATTQQTVGKSPEQIKTQSKQQSIQTKKLSSFDLNELMKEFSTPEEKIQAVSTLVDNGYTIEGVNDRDYSTESTSSLKGSFGKQQNDALIPHIPRIENTQTEDPSTVGGLLLDYGKNIGTSALNLGIDVTNAATHVLEPGKQNTLLGIGKAVGGTALNATDYVTEKVLGTKDAVGSLVGDGLLGDITKEMQDISSGIGQALKQRYGGDSRDEAMKNISDTAYNDPVGMFSDILSIVGMGGSALKAGSSVSKGALATKVSGIADDLIRAGALDPANMVFDANMNVTKGGYNVAKQGVQKVGTTIGDIKVPRGIQQVVDNTVASVKGISKAEKQAISDNPYKSYHKEVFDKIDKGEVPTNLADMRDPYVESVVNDIDKAVDTVRNQLGEEGPAFQALRSDPTPIDTTNMLADMQKVLYGSEWTLDTLLKKADPGNLLGTRNVLNTVSDTKTLHDIRKGFDRILYVDGVPNKNLDPGVKKVLDEIRGIVDKKLKENPDRAMADRRYNKAKEFVREIEEGITYREKRRAGQLKDNIGSIVENLTNPSRKQLLARLEKYVPGIGDRVASIKMIPKLAKVYTETPKASLQGAFSVGSALGLAGGLPGFISGFVSGLVGPGIMSTIRKKSLVDAVNSVSKKSQTKLEDIIKRVANREKVPVTEKIKAKKLLKNIQENIKNKEAKRDMQMFIDEVMKGGQLKNPALPNKAIQGETPNTIIAPGKPIVTGPGGNFKKGQILEINKPNNAKTNLIDNNMTDTRMYNSDVGLGTIDQIEAPKPKVMDKIKANREKKTPSDTADAKTTEAPRSTFDEYFNSLTDQQLIDLKGNPNRTILERAKVRKIWDETNPKNIVSKKAVTLKNIEVKKQYPDYGISHRPTKTNATADNISNLGQMPEDVYSNPELYFNMKDKAYKESMEVLKKIKGNPEAEVIIYRAGAKDEFNEGDRITLSKIYAQEHMEKVGSKGVFSKRVKAKDIHYAGDNINEFGYYPTTSDIPKQNVSDKIKANREKKNNNQKYQEQYYTPNTYDSDVMFTIMQDIEREVKGGTYQTIDSMFNKLEKSYKNLTEETVQAIEKKKEEVFNMDKLQKEYFNDQVKKTMFNDDYWKKYENFKKEAQIVESIEQRIGKVGKNKVNTEYSRTQNSNWTKRKEKLIQRIGEEFGLDQFDAVDMYDSFI